MFGRRDVEIGRLAVARRGAVEMHGEMAIIGFDIPAGEVAARGVEAWCIKGQKHAAKTRAVFEHVAVARIVAGWQGTQPFEPGAPIGRGAFGKTACQEFGHGVEIRVFDKTAANGGGYGWGSGIGHFLRSAVGVT